MCLFVCLGYGDLLCSLVGAPPSQPRGLERAVPLQQSQLSVGGHLLAVHVLAEL